MPGQNDTGRGISRRRLLAGGAAAGAALPVLHELIPHQGIHGGTDPALGANGHGAAHPLAPGGRPLHAQQVGAAVDHRRNGFDPTDLLRDFDWGKTRRLASGRTLREWEIVAADKELEVAPGVFYEAWTYNGRVPGPTLRAREGELLRVHFRNGSEHPHTMHFHGVHSAFADGMPGVGEARGGGQIEPGESYTYEFDAEPFGCHLYHCHTSPLATHIARGLYGGFVIDPKSGREEADELVMVLNGFDTNFDLGNELYAVNSIPFHFLANPIEVDLGQLVRIYVINVLEFDPINSFHIHANFFDHFPTGTRLEPSELTDTIILGQGQRSIVELRFPKPGKFMFHAHVNEFTELGWVGFFEVS